jgi:hypothetical protein
MANRRHIRPGASSGRFGPSRRQLLFRGFVFAALAAIPICLCRAQDESPKPPDRVWLAPRATSTSARSWYPPEVTPLVGRVTRWDDRQFGFVIRGDKTETLFPAERVLWVRAGGISKNEAAAMRQFADRNYAEALRPLIDVLQERPPVWRQQWLSMLAAYAAWHSSREAIAMELVRQLDARPLPPLVLAFLPVRWSRSDPAATAVDHHLVSLTDPSPAVRLVAASWLLPSRHRSRAIAALDVLIRNGKRPQIARLAAALQWQAAAPEEVVQNAGRWEAEIDSLPMVLQVGPTRTLIEKLTAAGQSAAAKRLQLSLEVTPPFPDPALTRDSR